MRRRPSQQAPPPHAYPTYPEERKAGPPAATLYVPQASAASSSGGGRSYPRSYLPNHPSSGGQQSYTGGGQSSGGGGTKSFQQTASMHGRWALKGLEDSCRIQKASELVKNDARLRGNLVRSLLINIPLLLSLLFLSFVILPLLSKAPSSRNPNPSFVSWLLRSPQLWQFLGTGGVVLVNGVWQGQIAERAWGLNGGGAGGGAMGVNGASVGGGSLSTRAIILLDFILVTSTFRLVPYIGWIFAFGYTLLINSYYCFEYIQIQQGYPLPDRILFLQSRSSYFSGFALPLTLLTSLPFLPPLASTTIFALLFPGFLILAASARPVPAAGAFGGLGGVSAGGEEEGDAGGDGGGDGEWWEWWPRRVRVLEGALWAVGMWEAVVGGLSAGGTRGGHRRKGSRL